MLQLPNEVLLKILGYLYYIDHDFCIYGGKADLLASRLACRRLAEIGKNLAFEYITFIQDEEGYKRLLEMSRSAHACLSVQRLTCYFEDYETSQTPEAFAASQGIDREHWAVEEFNEVYKKYCRGCQYQDLLEEGNLDIASLGVALPRFYRLRSIKILRDLSDLEDDWFLIDSSFTYSQADHQFFEAITSVLSVLGLGIEELSLGSFEDSPSLVGIIQGLTPARLRLYQQAFGTVKRLEMLLPFIVYDEDSRSNYDLNYAGISALIQSAPLFEELRLEFDMCSSEPLPPSFLGSLKLPSLRTLTLMSAEFKGPLCLTDFLSKHAISLKKVNFGTLTLQTGSWETLFIGMRDALTLDAISMVGDFRLDGWTEIRPKQEEHGRKVLNNRAIENFIQRRTNDNPFNLLRSARASIPPHDLSTLMHRLNGRCPYQSCLTTEERIS